MLPRPFQSALVLTGPTACGKTALGVELAERLHAEIVSMDSMALYRGMDIGTAKPTTLERQRVSHYLVDVLDPWQSASVAWWLQAAAHCVTEIEERGKQVLFVGGTPLYLNALLRGLFRGPPAVPEVRQRLTVEAQQLGTTALHQRLAEVDPVAATRIHAHDLRRIIRALEVWEVTGRPISVWQTQWQRREARDERRETSVFSPLASRLSPLVWLDLPRSELYARINARVDRMIEAGLVDEVRRLRDLPQPLSREASQALGYKEILAHLDGNVSLDETIDSIKTRSRHFAKRQLSWFRHLPECRPASRQLTFSLWGLTMEHKVPD